MKKRKTFKRNPIDVEHAAEEALAWIERQTEGMVIDCKDSLRLALYGNFRTPPKSIAQAEAR